LPHDHYLDHRREQGPWTRDGTPLFAAAASRCPFLVEWPDENLADWFGDGLLAPGHVLELGCGHGRNATYLAGLGCAVDAIGRSSARRSLRQHSYYTA
jgi:SAM-dependent methyltransferase